MTHALNTRPDKTVKPNDLPRDQSLLTDRGYSCDEYPFRSTYQGASTGGGTGRTFDWCQIILLPTGVTGPNGYSSCMIPVGENSSAGSLLNNFYVNFRVIDTDPFYVWIDD